MKLINWNNEKNEWLKQHRNISFEDIVFYIENGQVIDDVDHPNKKKFLNQRVFVININEYIYLVPYVESKSEIFLKTIIPSRKATKTYLEGRHG